MSRDRLAIAVADVSGKGVPAALYMTLTKGLLAATAQDDLTLASMLEEMNTHLCTVGQRKTFVTMALGILDPAARSLEYARAGHNPTVWRRPSLGTTSLLNSKGVGLGITAGRVFGRTLVVEKLDLTSGDTLVFYSDGLTEAMNEELEQFGEERLMQAVEKVDGMAAGAARDAILRDVADFLGGLAPQDDLTLVVLRVD
jgi:sigma-B regulation protein RsbU (phosphoserine phosphatase)